MTATAKAESARPAWQIFMPPLFVLLWSSGFIVTKLGVKFAEPFTFLFYRFAIVAALFLAIALMWRAPWPRNWRLVGHIAVLGVFLHATYLGGVYTAIALGIPAGICALIVGVQPIITGVLVGPLLGERVSPRQWFGLALGFLGIGAVLWEKLSFDMAHLTGVLWNIVGLFGMTAATLYQKKYCGLMDWRSGGAIQYGAAAIVTFIMIMVMGEAGAVDWSPEIIFAYLWLIFALSIGGVSLFGWIIRRGAASRVASLLYLVPPTTALGAWLMFDETLGGLALVGMVVTLAGVWLVNRA
ncbi:MAG: DMT family transporter [Dongiaceae bacterium]